MKADPVVWGVVLGMVLWAASCETFRPTARPLCGPTHPEYLGGCDILAERRWRK